MPATRPTTPEPTFECPSWTQRGKTLVIHVKGAERNFSYPTNIDAFDVDNGAKFVTVTRRSIRTDAAGTGTLNVPIPPRFETAEPIVKATDETGTLNRPEVKHVRLHLIVSFPGSGAKIFEQDIVVMDEPEE